MVVPEGSPPGGNRSERRLRQAQPLEQAPPPPAPSPPMPPQSGIAAGPGYPQSPGYDYPQPPPPQSGPYPAAPQPPAHGRPASPPAYPSNQPQPVPAAYPAQPQPAVPPAQPHVSRAQPVPVSPTAPASRPQPLGARPQQPKPAARPGSARPIPVKAGKPTVTEDRDEEVDEGEISELAIKYAPPWVISALFHGLLLLLLGVTFFVVSSPDDRLRLKAETIDPADEEEIWAEELGEQLEIEVDSYDDVTEKDPTITPDDLPPVDDPFAAPMNLEIDPTITGFGAVSDIEAPMIGLALKGREVGTRNSLIQKYGGTRKTEDAVEAGLEWLKRQQDKREGSWSLCGPYKDGVPKEFENKVAATALALIAFQGHNDTHQTGEHKRTVAMGWDWLLKQQQADGSFFLTGPHFHRFYTEGMCGIALFELYAMTKDERFRQPAERLLDYLLRSQSSKGGWKYNPMGSSDCSVTGWVVMALQSSRMAGFEVPDKTFAAVGQFLDTCASDGGSKYGYESGDSPRNAMTAEGLLVRQYLGWKKDDERLVKGVDYITSAPNLINFDRGRDTYYWYYATQVCHHMEGDHWDKWNKVMRQEICEHQEKHGKEAGSWDPNKPSRDRWAVEGGRLYVTCLSIYNLEVYYRHLPLYKDFSAWFQSNSN